MKTNRDMAIMCKNISNARKKGGLTKLEMAKLMGVGVKTITKIEHCVVPDRLGVDKIIKVCKYLNCTPKDIFDREL